MAHSQKWNFRNAFENNPDHKIQSNIHGTQRRDCSTALSASTSNRPDLGWVYPQIRHPRNTREALAKDGREFGSLGYWAGPNPMELLAAGTKLVQRLFGTDN